MSAPTASGLRNFWPWLALLAIFAWLLAVLSPILMPFIASAALAYMGNPVVGWLERRRLPRTAAVCIVFATIVFAVLGILLAVAPTLADQTAVLLDTAPEAVNQLRAWLRSQYGLQLPNLMDTRALSAWVRSHWSTAGNAAGLLAQSGMSLLATLANLALIPVLTFYLLRDWPRLIARIDCWIPPRIAPLLRRLACESDEVLGQFLRGQLWVVIALTVYYSVALWVVGLKLSIVVALIAGAFSFVPYLGFVVGFGSALLAVAVQAPELTLLLWVSAVFMVGQVLEGNVLTPLLVGDRIGVHPVAVIFALMAGAQLLGFAGMLVALPVAAVAAVALRELERRWHQSVAYQTGQPPSIITSIDDGG